MTITREQIIWYPGIYSGRQDSEYNQKVGALVNDDKLNVLIKLVQKRAHEDADWSITMGFVGDNQDKMRRMESFVANEENIRQCVTHIFIENQENDRTVDWLCRDLAHASKWMIR